MLSVNAIDADGALLLLCWFLMLFILDLCRVSKCTLKEHDNRQLCLLLFFCDSVWIKKARRKNIEQASFKKGIFGQLIHLRVLGIENL